MGKSKCCCTTDKAPAILGQRSGFGASALEFSSRVTFMHCLIHRFAFSDKVDPAELSSALPLVVKMTNHPKGRALNSQLFKLLYEDFGADHCTSFPHPCAFAFRGNIKKRVYELPR